jgi:hypothetical protein
MIINGQLTIRRILRILVLLFVLGITVICVKNEAISVSTPNKEYGIKSLDIYI